MVQSPASRPTALFLRPLRRAELLIPRAHTGDEPLLPGDAAKQPGQLPALVLGQGGADVVLVRRPNGPELGPHELPALRSQEQGVPPAVVGVPPPLDQAAFLEVVHQRHKPAGRGPQLPGELLLYPVLIPLVLAVGLAAGWVRHRTGAVGATIGMHIAVDLGLFLAAVALA